MATVLNEKKPAREREIVADAKPAPVAELLDACLSATTDPRAAVAAGVEAMVAHALAGEGFDDSAELSEVVDHLIAELESRLSEQKREITRHEKFKRLEATWRGLEYLFHQTAGEGFELRALAATDAELRTDMRKNKSYRRSRLFKLFARDEYLQAGGKPYSFVAFDKPFSQAASDVALLKYGSKIAADGHFLVIGGAAPEFFGGSEFADLLENPEDLVALFGGQAYIPYREFRECDTARNVGLVLPRMLMRAPWDRTDNPAPGAEYFDEKPRDSGDLCWGNPAYAFAARLGASLRDYGFPVAVTGARSGGKIEDLPLVSFATERGIASRPPIEIMLDDLMEGAISSLGFIPLVVTKDSSHAVFYSAGSVQKPPKPLDADQAAGAMLRAQLPNLAAANRIAHFVKILARDMVGSPLSDKEVEASLDGWLKSLCLNNAHSATRQQKAERPLSDASIVVRERNPGTGHYEAELTIKPHQNFISFLATLLLRAATSDK